MKKIQPLTQQALASIAGFEVTEELVEIWAEFVEYRGCEARTRIKTEKSQERIFKKLLKLSTNIPTICGIIEQTIDRGWMGFFELQSSTDVGSSTITRKDMDNQPVEKHAEMRRENLQKYMQLYPEKFGL